MGFRPSLTMGLVCSVLGATMAHATDQGPVLVIPGRPGIPVVINGYDASYTIVEGDWGLARPGQVSPVIVSGPLIAPAPYYAGHYYPSLGRRPGYGRSRAAGRPACAASGAQLLPRMGRRVAEPARHHRPAGLSAGGHRRAYDRVE